MRVQQLASGGNVDLAVFHAQVIAVNRDRGNRQKRQTSDGHMRVWSDFHSILCNQDNRTRERAGSG